MAEGDRRVQPRHTQRSLANYEHLNIFTSLLPVPHADQSSEDVADCIKSLCAPWQSVVGGENWPRSFMLTPFGAVLSLPVRNIVSLIMKSLVPDVSTRITALIRTLVCWCCCWRNWIFAMYYTSASKTGLVSQSLYPGMDSVISSVLNLLKVYRWCYEDNSAGFWVCYFTI